jgi:hypothetical protein
MHPDYTFSFWPAELKEETAKETCLLVLCIFDAKYRH